MKKNTKDIQQLQQTAGSPAATRLDDSELRDVAGGLISPAVTTAAVPWWFNNILEYGNWRGIQ